MKEFLVLMFLAGIDQAIEDGVDVMSISITVRFPL